MRPYEATIIFEPTADDEVIRGLVERFSEVATSRGATVGRVDHWGRRRLAYEIQHHREGYYVLLEMSGPFEALEEMSRLLHLTDEVLRHKVIRVPDPAKRPSGPTTGEDVAAESAAGGS